MSLDLPPITLPLESTMRRLLVLLVLMTALPPATHAAPPPNDPALWLEDVTGTQAMQWVGEQNARSTRELAQSAEFKSLDDRFLSILNSNDRIPYVTKIGDRYYNFWRDAQHERSPIFSNDRIPYVTKIGDRYYNFWRDAQHERGLWRRTTLEEYRKPSPAWETDRKS